MIDPPRTLADFEPLPPAEAQVLRALRTGTIAKLGLRRPHDAEPRVRLRGAFLSFLARGGAGVPAGGAGLQIVGACISGRFDLSGSTAPMSVWFYRCLFLTAPRLDRAHVVGSASFADCALPGLRAEACRVDEHLSLGAGCQVDGEVRIARARIGRDLDCERLQMSAGAAAEHGFIAACNDGASLARGEYLIFLNNDTIPQPGWLEALLDTFSTEPGAGLVGAQLLYPDGHLQEAGGVVFADGSGWNYGKFESPDDPRFAYLRDCDYASGAAIAIPRALFAALGGFDARYAPAYYEDTDLAFAVRAAGHRVLYQPASKVVHVEGGTAGTDTAVGMKAYQVRNRATFAAHRAAALASQLPANTVPTPALLHRRQKQILIIDAQTPRPDHDSGSLRLVNLMRLLREEGAHVVFLPADRHRVEPFATQLQRMGVESWHAPFAARPPAWLREHGARFDAVMVSRHYVAAEFLPLLRAHAPQARRIFDTVDLHYLRERRGAEVAGDAALARAAERTRAL